VTAVILSSTDLDAAGLDPHTAAALVMGRAPRPGHDCVILVQCETLEGVASAPERHSTLAEGQAAPAAAGVTGDDLLAEATRRKPVPLPGHVRDPGASGSPQLHPQPLPEPELPSPLPEPRLEPHIQRSQASHRDFLLMSPHGGVLFRGSRAACETARAALDPSARP